ncbi:hypothetical protein TTHERM_00375020 (macronuclear) [Tetrahymena thermophila SB210]|uniref:ALMS motif domain-containing protein n=1 Tax=Tetrahymena thermophila (strain SB210) TaxID=312017 RepID=I7MHS9_TETTS|nr:hypothetical protein TTHERM_00375020 [Tetrahymena thermophila SB210]EAR89385.2 hypothetical protein TTHERM_00375020 [Tetrahymena thermophila SB210]|eukprot:XP_001009630.2 hypothetical protein TTHERM_00375020 [Tetrahymena thermophila SB210]
MGQGISCTDERSTIDMNQQYQQQQQQQYQNPVQTNNQDLYIEPQQKEYQEYKRYNTTNQFNVVSLNTSQISIHKDGYDSRSEISRMPSQISLASEFKKIETDDINPLTTQFFNRNQDSESKEHIFVSRNQSREVLQEIISVPQSANRQIQRPSSNCKLSTRVQEKLLEQEDEHSIALNFSPSKNYQQNIKNQADFNNDASVLNDISYQYKKSSNELRNSNQFSSVNSLGNSNDIGFRYLQSGINQLAYDQQVKVSFGQSKTFNTSYQTNYYKNSNYTPTEEQKISKRYVLGKENILETEMKNDEKSSKRQEMLTNLEKLRVASKPLMMAEEKKNPLPINQTIQQVNEQKIDKNTFKVNRKEIKEDEFVNLVKNNNASQKTRSKSNKRNEIILTQRNVSTKCFKEDELVNKRGKSKGLKNKLNKRKYSSSCSSSSSSSSPSLSSHDSYQEGDFQQKNQVKQSKKGSHKSNKKTDIKNQNILSKKASEQLSNIPLNDENSYFCTAPQSNYNSNLTNQQQNFSTNQQQFLLEERNSNRSTAGNSTHQQSSQISQNKQCNLQQHLCSNHNCHHNNPLSPSNCQACSSSQIISSRLNNFQQFTHTCQNKLNTPMDGNNFINRNQSNLSVCQNNSSLNMGIQVPQQNQFGLYGLPTQQNQIQTQLTSQIQQIQQQLFQQQLALVQTQQNHQTQIQNILFQQQQQQHQHQALQLIPPPYNILYGQTASPYMQQHIAQSHIIGNFTNQHIGTPADNKQNPILGQYYQNSQVMMPQSACQNQLSTPINSNHQEQILDFQYIDKNNTNTFNQAVNSVYPSAQQQQQQYIIHPSLGNQNQPIIINNNLVSPKKNKNKNNFEINGSKNMVLSHEILDEKLKNMQSLSFNINSSNISNEIKNEQNDNDDFDILDANDEDFDEIQDTKNNKTDQEKTNANKPLSMQTRGNLNSDTQRSNFRSFTQEKDTFTFRNNKQQNKNQSLMNSNFDEMIRNTNIEQIEQFDNSNKVNANKHGFEKLEIDLSTQVQPKEQQKSLAEIFQEKRKKLAQKMDGQKRAFSTSKVEEKVVNENKESYPVAVIDELPVGNQHTGQKESKGKRSKEDMIKLRQEMKEYGNRVNPKLKAKAQQRFQSEQEQLNQESINGNQRMKSPNYSKKREELMIRLAQGIKPKISEKEMYALTKKNYENLPEVKRKRQEQEKQINKQELLKIKQEKLKELDEKRRSKFKLKGSVSNLNMTKQFTNNNHSSNQSSTQLII